MIDKDCVKNGFARISKKIDENKERLIELDRQNGDGDLGISMSDGFHAVCAFLENTEEVRLTQLFSQAGNAFNEAAPSSLGTILSFFMKGIAKGLKGKEGCSTKEMASAMQIGIQNIMDKAGSKAGEKTILDALIPAVHTLESDESAPWAAAAAAAAAGSEATRQMKAVWGRAAYYGEQSVGILDGGSYVGALIFQALNEMRGEENDGEL